MIQSIKFKFTLLLCWLGIHRFRIIHGTFGFGKSGATDKVECKICGAVKIKESGTQAQQQYHHIYVHLKSTG